MKKYILLVLAMSLTLVLVACNDEPVVEYEPEYTPTVEVAPEPEYQDEPEVVDEEPEIIDEEPEVALNVSDESDLHDITNHWVELNGVRFVIGQTVSDFENTFLEVGRLHQDHIDGELSAMSVSSLGFQYQNAAGRTMSLSTGIINLTGEEIPVRDARVNSITLDSGSAEHLESYSFFNPNIRLRESTPEDIVALFGEPDRITGSDASPVLRFESSDWGGFTGSTVVFTFSEHFDGKLVTVLITNYNLD